MAPLNHKKKTDRGTLKSGFALIDQSVTLNFEQGFVLDTRAIYKNNAKFYVRWCHSKMRVDELKLAVPA